MAPGRGTSARGIRLAPLVLLASLAPSLPLSSPRPFVGDVTRWLDRTGVPWENAPLHSSVAGGRTDCSIALGERNGGRFFLHLLPTPSRPEECVPPDACARMTDESAVRIIHIHEDVWRHRGDIVRSRLLARLGRSPRRIYGRKTSARRIGSDPAMEFLEEHHLWSATRAKYNFGLFLPVVGGEEELVAVAAFSSRRKVLRDGVPHRSHELMRVCSVRDGSVVGGISKLLRAFTSYLEANGARPPDDLVTVVDRDWGTGAGWHALGFETVQVAAPLIMAVGSDGLRRHCVGAGIGRNGDGGMRPGLPERVRNELGQTDDVGEALRALYDAGMYPVHDSGVERLMMLVGGSEAGEKTAATAQELWGLSKPTYAAAYYSDNSGIAALLLNAAATFDGVRRSGSL